MKPNKRTLTSQGTYAGVAKTDTIALPRDYVLQRIFIDTRGTLDIATSAVVLVEDAGQRLLSGIQVKLTGNYAGNKTVIDVDGVDLYFINFYDYGEGLERVNPTATGTSLAMSFQLCIDFRLAKNDPDDFSVGIPLYDTSSADLILSWDTEANGYKASGGTISNWSLTTKITLFEAIPESADEFTKAKGNPIYTLTSVEYTADTNTASGEERNTDIATGDLLRRLLFIVRDSSDLRSDTEIDKLSLRKINEFFYEEMDWDAFGLEDESDYSLANYDGDRHIKGAIMFDFARGAFDEQGRVFGEDLTNLKSGDMKIKIWKNNASSILRYISESIIAKAAAK